MSHNATTNLSPEVVACFVFYFILFYLGGSATHRKVTFKRIFKECVTSHRPQHRNWTNYKNQLHWTGKPTEGPPLQAAQEIWDKQATLKHDHEPLCTTTNCYPSTLLQKCSHDYKSTSMSVKQKRSFSSSSLGCRHGSRISLDTRKVDAECRLYTTNVLFICFF